MMRSEINRRQFSENKQSLFSYRYSAWANNHNGWSKMKKKNRRRFKKKFKDEDRKMINIFLSERY
jgi:hypothetical protein